MKLIEYLEAITKSVTKDKTVVELKNIFQGAVVSGSLGVPASSFFGSSSFDEKLVIKNLKKNLNIKNVIYIPKNNRSNYPNMNSEVFKSSQESFMITLKDGRNLFFKDTSGSGKKNIRNIPSIISEKELTPDSLGLAGKIHSRDELIEFLKTHSFKPLVKKIVIMITNSISAIRSSSTNITYDVKGLNTEMSKLSDADEARIFKDLGEVFSAIVSSSSSDKIFFPKESNFSLIDFIVERSNRKKKSYSAKFNEGAKPSLSGVINNIEQNEAILKDDSEEKEVYEILKIINGSSSFVASEELSKRFGLEKQVKKEVLQGAKKRGINLKDPKASKLAYNYVRSKLIKTYLNSQNTSNGSKIIDVFSSLMNSSFNIDQVVIKERKGDSVDWHYYDFKESRFQFEDKNSFIENVGKISFKIVQSVKKK